MTCSFNRRSLVHWDYERRDDMMRLFERLTLSQVFMVQLLMLSAGPVLMVLAALAGGEVADTFAGGTAGNSQLGSFLLDSAAILSWVGLGVSILMALVYSAKRAAQNRRYLLLWLSPLLILPLLVAAFVANYTLHECVDPAFGTSCLR